MSQIELFDNLMQNARRDDGYINATKWCKHFGYRLDNWKQLPETQDRLTKLSKRLKITNSVSKEADYTDDTECLKITALNSEINTVKITALNSEINTLKIRELICTSGKGRGAVTWIHPIMAVHLASYLDPDFANYVAEVFIRYVTADPTLAADIASRQETTEGLDIINNAVQERYEFLNSKLARAYYVIRDAWGDKLHYNTLTGEIQLNGSPLKLQSLKLKLDRELDVKVGQQDAKQIVRGLAIVNTYPSMDAANQQKFAHEFRFFSEYRHFVPTKECPTPPKLS